MIYGGQFEPVNKKIKILELEKARKEPNFWENKT